MKFDRKKFFAAYNRSFGELTLYQVQGLNRLLRLYETYWGWWDNIDQIGNSLAQVKHESAHSFNPVVEGYYLGDKGKLSPEDYFHGNNERVKRFQKRLKYFPYFGIGELLQVLPVFSCLNVAYRLSVNLIFISNLLMSSIISKYFQNLIFSKFRVRSFAMCISFLFIHIVVVVNPSAFFQMCGITTRRIITLKMANNFILSKVAFINQLIHKTVSQLHSAVIKNSTVASFISITCPKPTIVGFFNSAHQASFQRFFSFVRCETFVRTIFCSVVAILKFLFTTKTNYYSLNISGFEFTFIGTIKTFRTAEWLKRFTALLTSICLVYSLVKHYMNLLNRFVFWLGSNSVSSTVRAVFILPQNLFISNDLEVCCE